MRLFISREEHLRRTGHARTEAARRGLDGLVLFSPAQVFYLTGFAFIATERPIALVVGPETTVLYVPRLEDERAAMHAVVDRVVSYPEYPTETHPMRRLVDLLTELRLDRARLGVDGDGYPDVMGYRGPRLCEIVPQATVRVVRDLVEEMMIIKSAEEIDLIRESARWGNVAHALLQEYTRPGVIESEVALRASYEATGAMIRALGPQYQPLNWTSPDARAGYRGQVGKQSAARMGIGPQPVSAMRALAMRPSSSSLTVAATPTSAKSPCRRASSSKAHPIRGGDTGSRTSARSSTGSRLVAR